MFVGTHSDCEVVMNSVGFGIEYNFESKDFSLVTCYEITC